MGIQLNITRDEQQQRILFRKEDINFYGYTTYTKEVWEKIKDINWYINDKAFLAGEKTYIYTGSTRFGKKNKLHQIVMLIWYGEEEFNQAYAENFKSKLIVEHHDNNEFNCLIENLSFTSDHFNISKAHTYDIERPQLIDKVAVNFFKNFKTREYQITLGFNEPYFLEGSKVKKGFEVPYSLVEGSKVTNLMEMYLIYNDDFRLVVQDASYIVWSLLNRDCLDLSRLEFIEKEIKDPTYIYPNGEKLPAVAFIKGEVYLIRGDDTDGTARIESIAPKKELYGKNEKG